MAISMPKDSKGTCSDCGSTNDYVFGPHGSEHECYDCGASPASITAAGDEADNAAEAQALAQTNPGALATPRDRSSDPNRQAHALEQSIMEHSLGGMPQYTDHQCSNHGGTGEHDENENNVCPDCGSNWAESQREPY